MRTAFVTLAFGVAVVSQAFAYDVVLMDNPAIRLQFDRKYEVFKVEKKDGSATPGQLAYMMLPEDQQSSVALFLGEGFELQTEESIAKDHPGEKITKVDGMIGQLKVQWWHYKDSSHFCSTCVLTMPLRKDKKLPIMIDLVANTPLRLASLEDSFSRMQMVENPPNQAAEPTRPAVTPTANAPVAPAGARGSP